MDDLSCEAARERLAELAPPDESLRAHLAKCAACRAEAEALGALAGNVRDAFAAERPPEGAIPRFDDVLHAARDRGSGGVRSRRSRVLARAAALLLAAIFGAAIDRAIVRSSASAGPAPAAPATARVREALASRPGGLAPSLAVLSTLTSPSRSGSTPRGSAR